MKQFMKYADVDETEADRRAVEFYRERYEVKGIFENLPYGWGKICSGN